MNDAHDQLILKRLSNTAASARRWKKAAVVLTCASLAAVGAWKSDALSVWVGHGSEHQQFTAAIVELQGRVDYDPASGRRSLADVRAVSLQGALLGDASLKLLTAAESLQQLDLSDTSVADGETDLTLWGAGQLQPALPQAVIVD